ncbi:MAG: YceH family protein [Verrucomicrobiales bacterium]|nr:YceH family protein [Verrucomicrobiales bacterium]
MSEETDTIEEGNEAVGKEPMLTFEEARVLGCLIEKETTTPDHYPLTLNSLHSACNQSSNRDPVVDFGTDVVEETLEGLRLKKLAVLLRQAGARVPKYKHTIENKFPYLTDGQRAIICVLLLRGQQTVGEIRTRTERLHPFADIERTQAVLDQLAEFQPAPLVRHIPAGGGRRVATYVHLLCGEVELSAPASSAVQPQAVASPSWREDVEEEIASLKAEVLSLRSELEELKNNLGV